MAYRFLDKTRYYFLQSELASIEVALVELQKRRAAYVDEAVSLIEEFFDESQYHPDYVELIDQFIKDHDGRIPEKFQHDRHFYLSNELGWNVEGLGPSRVYYRDVELRIKDGG